MGGLSYKAHDRADIVSNSLKGRGGCDPLAIESHSLPGRELEWSGPTPKRLDASIKKAHC